LNLVSGDTRFINIFTRDYVTQVVKQPDTPEHTNIESLTRGSLAHLPLDRGYI